MSARSPMLLHERRHILGIKAQEAPPLDERKSAILNQAPDVTDVHTELLCDIVDRQKPQGCAMGLLSTHEIPRPPPAR